MKIKITDKVLIEFQPHDFKAGIPLVLIGIVLYYNVWDKGSSLLYLIAYYLCYFSWDKVEELFKGIADRFEKQRLESIERRKTLCPHCGSNKTVFHTWATSGSDEEHPLHRCLACDKYSVMTEGGLA